MPIRITQRKKATSFIFAVILIMMFIPVQAQKLDDNLKLMEPFTKKKWESKMQGLRGEGIIISQREWKIIWNGKAIRATSVTEKLKVYSDGYFFWDPVIQEIAFFTINNKGRIRQGHVKLVEGKIVMVGHITLADRKLKFKNYFEFTKDGKLIDKWYRFENNQWKAGHAIELYEAK